ncbi:inorganic phosphate transporter [Thermococcus camini]|uniref:Inorganic phosphate transporter, PiT family n=1 Tax=Thermococcus camini TaxID=2016373 RepID=A0A7G2D939_9EURY|nr:inorganic phosphate transporter [Thermococcus camini]CAD5244159.1 Inorganic phosphate transporter, PiT family [Thermococcus camini]
MIIPTALFMAWAIGANDSAKAVGTAVGSGVISFKRAVLLIGIFTTLGVIIGGSSVSGTVSGLAEGMSAVEVGLVLFSAASAVTLASLWGRPISTTQSIIGGLVGASLALGLPVDWWTVGKIASAWVLSPIVAALFAVAVYRLYKPMVRRIKCLRNLELTQKWLVFTAAAFSAFNLGANELSNVAGLMESLGINGPFRLVLAITLALGALTFSYEVMMTVGRDISPLGPTSAFSSQFGASLAVSAANLIGLPVSSGQAIVGAISGLGLYKGEHVNIKLLVGIVKGWVIAPVFAGTIAYLLITFLA